MNGYKDVSREYVSSIVEGEMVDDSLTTLGSQYDTPVDPESNECETLMSGKSMSSLI